MDAARLTASKTDRNDAIGYGKKGIQPATGWKTDNGVHVHGKISRLHMGAFFLQAENELRREK
ncbi:MAG: hypothetical protein RQ736_03710 [Thiogranum sp.]|nr:hypothetical protein [Thiogranum sp.]